MTRVLVASEIRLYRDGLVVTLDERDEIEVVGTASSAEELLGAVSDCAPEVVLLHMEIPGSLASVSAVAQTYPEVNVVALGVPELEREVIACAEAGISGYVPRDGSVDDLVAVVTSAVRGELCCSPRIARELLRRVAVLAAECSGGEEELCRLTPREAEIAELIEQGLSNKEIALELAIEVSTVKNHVHSILDRLNVHRRGEAAARLRRILPPQRSLLRQDLVRST